MSIKAQWFGWPGHFVGSVYCRFSLHTRVGPLRISTVGNMAPGVNMHGDAQPIGSSVGCGDKGGRLFETMVFALEDNGTPEGEMGEGVYPAWARDLTSHYWTTEDAQAGHEAHVAAALDVMGGVS